MIKLICAGLAMMTLSFASIAGAKDDSRKWEDKFDGSALPSTSWHVGELWWYGLAEVVSFNCNVDCRKDDATVFWLDGEATADGAFFGVRFPWCAKGFQGAAYHKPSQFLERGFVYKFKIGMDEKPDLVLANGKEVWRKESGGYENKYVEFLYAPSAEREELEIAILKELGKGQKARLTFARAPYFERPKMKCFRAKAVASDEAQLKSFAFPSGMKVERIDPEIANSRLERFNNSPCGHDSAGIPAVPYKTGDIKFIANTNETGDDVNAAYFLDNAKRWGFDIVDLNQKTLAKGAAFDPAASAKTAGLDRMIIPGIETGDGKFLCDHWIRFLEKGQMEEAKAGTVALIKRCLKENPDGTVYLMYPEFSSIFGDWDGGVQHSPMRKIPGMADVVSAGGTRAYEAICEYWAKTSADLKRAAPEGKLKIVALYSGGIHGELLAKIGADILMNKHIHRKCQNIIVANARGPANASGREYGFDNDCWNRCYVYDYAPEEIRQNLLVYYFSGARYMYPELVSVSSEKPELTAAGREWIDFIRYCKTHPAPGQQRVRIAVMRGLPDEWNRFASPSASWEAAKDGNEAEFHDYFEDYDLLNLVFPNFGLFYRTFPDRLCTGTPYGPVDFVPWNAQPEKLAKYDLTVYLGKSNCMTPAIYGCLKRYVVSGGTLIAAIGQFRDADGKLLKTDFRDFLGVECLGSSTLKADPEWDRSGAQTWKQPEGRSEHPVLKLSSSSARVVYRFKDSSPYVTENVVGKGKVVLFAGERLTEHDSLTPARMIMPELEKAKWLSISPSSDWIEYMIQKKGSSYAIPVFNHGNVGFPSGNGRKTGPWSGTVSLDLNKFDFPQGRLAVFELVRSVGDETPFKLKRIASVQSGERLSFEVKVDTFSELVAGPEDMVEKDCFQPKTQRPLRPGDR